MLGFFYSVGSVDFTMCVSLDEKTAIYIMIAKTYMICTSARIYCVQLACVYHIKNFHGLWEM